MESVKQLTWHTAHQGHRYQLQQFICANPERDRYDGHRHSLHPRPWELEVQSHLRGLRPPGQPGEAVRLGFEGDELVAAIHFGFDSTGDEFLIWAVGVSVKHRGRGFGREAVKDVVDALTRMKRDEKLKASLFARIWEKNKPSQRLFTEAGFAVVGETGKQGLQLWGLALPDEPETYHAPVDDESRP